MTTDASPLSLTYETFERFWKALVSKRKARKLNVDRDVVWQQLGQSGERAEFLRADAAAKESKRDAGRAANAATKEESAPTLPQASAPPKRTPAASKSAGTAKGAKSKRAAKPAARKGKAATGKAGRRKRP